MSQRDSVSIIMAVWNQLGYAKLAVDFILKNSPPTPFELVVIDNGSRPEVKDYFDSMRDKADISYIRNDKNVGPINAINQGIKASKYDYMAVIHTDVVVLDPGWLEKIISVMKSDPKIGIVGLAGRQEIYNTGCVNEASLKHSLQDDDLNEPMKEDMAEVAVIDGLCFVMRRELIDKIKGLDETYGYMHCYDLDVSMQSIAAGFKNVVVKVRALHLANGGMTRKTREYKKIVKDDYGLLKKNCKIFAQKWRKMLPVKIS
ncbi:MAG: glycosyltransferase [Candidatus Omnitrophota bacterium]